MATTTISLKYGDWKRNSRSSISCSSCGSSSQIPKEIRLSGNILSITYSCCGNSVVQEVLLDESMMHWMVMIKDFILKCSYNTMMKGCVVTPIAASKQEEDAETTQFLCTSLKDGKKVKIPIILQYFVFNDDKIKFSFSARMPPLQLTSPCMKMLKGPNLNYKDVSLVVQNGNYWDEPRTDFRKKCNEFMKEESSVVLSRTIDEPDHRKQEQMVMSSACSKVDDWHSGNEKIFPLTDSAFGSTCSTNGSPDEFGIKDEAINSKSPGTERQPNDKPVEGCEEQYQGKDQSSTLLVIDERPGAEPDSVETTSNSGDSDCLWDNGAVNQANDTQTKDWKSPPDKDLASTSYNQDLEREALENNGLILPSVEASENLLQIHTESCTTQINSSLLVIDNKDIDGQICGYSSSESSCQTVDALTTQHSESAFVSSQDVAKKSSMFSIRNYKFELQTFVKLKSNGKTGLSEYFEITSLQIKCPKGKSLTKAIIMKASWLSPVNWVVNIAVVRYDSYEGDLLNYVTGYHGAQLELPNPALPQILAPVAAQGNGNDAPIDASEQREDDHMASRNEGSEELPRYSEEENGVDEFSYGFSAEDSQQVFSNEEPTLISSHQRENNDDGLDEATLQKICVSEESQIVNNTLGCRENGEMAPAPEMRSQLISIDNRRTVESAQLQERQQRQNDYDRNRKTYAHWPKDKPPEEKMAEAGFQYTGHSDRVRCSSVFGCPLEEFQANDDPMEEHALHHPYCPFVRQTLRENDISEILQRREAPELTHVFRRILTSDGMASLFRQLPPGDYLANVRSAIESLYESRGRDAGIQPDTETLAWILSFIRDDISRLIGGGEEEGATGYSPDAGQQ